MEAVSSPLPTESCWLNVAGYLITTDLFRWPEAAVPEEMPLAGCADMLSKRKDFFLKIYFCF